MATSRKIEIEHLYNDLHLSQSQTAARLGVSRSRIAQLMKEFGIATRDHASASSNMNNQRTVAFTHDQEQLILGSMLGDANLHPWTMVSNKKSRTTLRGFRLTFAHSIKQLDYLLHKKAIIGGSEIGERLSGHGATIKHFSFCHSPSLRPYADLCLTDGKKQVTTRWLDKLDWLGVAYWYMDDGSLIISKNRRRNLRPEIQFHTESFTSAERELLRNMLRERFNLHTSLRKCNGDLTQQKIVSKHKEEVGDFLSSLRPHIIASMAYKIRWLWTDQLRPSHSQGDRESLIQTDQNRLP